MSALAQALEPAPVEVEVRELRPQEGPQTQFSNCDADIAVIGGGAFGGKSFGLLFEDTEHMHDPAFASVTFRRDTTQIRNPGGLWDEAGLMYAPFGARMLSNSLEALFPSGAVAKFAHLEHPDSVYAWDGAQIPLLKFDQLESFEESQFWYMLSRNRDPSGHIKPYCRATCNPDPDSFLRRLLGWWIDEKTGYAILERSGVIRWFIRDGETMHWADSREELLEAFARKDLPADDPLQPRPMSITFILARIWDNKIGLAKDPAYLSKLKAQARHERERLLGDPELGGNWNVRASAGMLFQRTWCTLLPAEPENVDWVRGWDRAATRPGPLNNDPDWTVGVRLGKYRGQNRYVIAPDVKRMRDGPAAVDKLIGDTAMEDGKHVRIRVPQDPGQAGKAQAKATVQALAGYSVKCDPVTGDKVVRFSPFSSQAEAGNVDRVIGIPEAFLLSLEAFPDAKHDDDADAVSEAFAGHHQGGAQNLLEFYRARAAAEKAAAEAKDGNPTIEGLPNHQVTRIDTRTKPVPVPVSRNAPPAKTVGQLQAERAAERKAKGLNGKKFSSFSEAMAAEIKGAE